MSNNSQKTPSISHLLGDIVGTIFLLVFLLLVLGIAALVLGFSATLVGRIIAQGSGLSVFEATLVTVIVGIAVVYFFSDKSRLRNPWDYFTPDEEDEDWEDEEDWEEEDEEEEEEVVRAKPINAVKPPPSRNDLCPCGSGRKYKNCHGR